MALGCLHPDFQLVAGFYDTVRATPTVEGTKEILSRMLTLGIPVTDLNWIANENLKMPHAPAADLLLDHSLSGLLNVIVNTRPPALVIGSRKSTFSTKSQEWTASVNPNAWAPVYE